MCTYSSSSILAPPSLYGASYLLLVIADICSIIWLAPCRNLCERVAVRAHNGSLYDLGMKYCPKCAIFFRSDEKNHCFCCGKRLRLRTRNSRTRNRNRCSMCNRRLVNSHRNNNEHQSSICLTCARL
jgi:hypothetical protein